MGRIVIETDLKTGKDHVELTLDTGQVMIFHGSGNSELRYHSPEVEEVDIPPHWTFSVSIKDIPGVIVNEPEPSEE